MDGEASVTTDKRIIRMGVRVSPAERDRIARHAADFGASPSAFVRAAVLMKMDMRESWERHTELNPLWTTDPPTRGLLCRTWQAVGWRLWRAWRRV